MKKNNKGFVLAEAIIVSVFVLGMFTYLAMNVIPLISRYERVVNYDNPQEIYLANTLYEEMLNVEVATNIKTDIELSIENTNNGTGDEPNLTCTRLVGKICTGSVEFYKELGKALKIEAIYTYDTTNSNKNCEGISNDKGLKNYCEYYTKRKNKDGSQKTITKAFMIKFSGDREDNSDKTDKAVNKKYATIVVPTE